MPVLAQLLSINHGTMASFPMKILVILSSCGGGDWPPVLALASGLARRGHAVKVVCDAGTKASVRTAGLAAICLADSESLGRRFNPMLQQILAGAQQLGATSPNPLIEWGNATLPLVEKTLRDWQPALILASLFCQDLAWMAAVAYRGKWCCVNPSFFFGDSTRLPQNGDFSPVGALMYQHWLLPPLCMADLVLHATDALFDGVQSLAANHLYTGSLTWEMPGHIPASLSEPGPPWILLSLSTAPQEGDLAIVHRTAQALKNEPCRVLVTLASPDHLAGLGSKLPDNMYISGYLPHSAVLPYCRMMISHAGHGLVAKAMRFGVPMLLIPWGRDQPGVAARAKARGVARVITRQALSVSALVEASRFILYDPLVAECAWRESQRLWACDPLPVALDRLAVL